MVDAFGRHVRSLETQARSEGLGSARLKTSPTSAMCLWSDRERRALNRKAQKFEAVAVVGCDSAVLTARRAVPVGGLLSPYHSHRRKLDIR
jgi:hypothetical protein